MISVKFRVPAAFHNHFQKNHFQKSFCDTDNLSKMQLRSSDNDVEARNHTISEPETSASPSSRDHRQPTKHLQYARNSFPLNEHLTRPPLHDNPCNGCHGYKMTSSLMTSSLMTYARDSYPIREGLRRSIMYSGDDVRRPEDIAMHSGDEKEDRCLKLSYPGCNACSGSDVTSCSLYGWCMFQIIYFVVVVLLCLFVASMYGNQ